MKHLGMVGCNYGIYIYIGIYMAIIYSLWIYPQLVHGTEIAMLVYQRVTFWKSILCSWLSNLIGG